VQLKPAADAVTIRVVRIGQVDEGPVVDRIEEAETGDCRGREDRDSGRF
jgi:hypothetical protein